MTLPVSEADSASVPVSQCANIPSSSVPTWRLWLPLALFSVLWIDLCRQLSYTWETREQYSYGWFVPFFALYLFWRRWQDRPVQGPWDSGTQGPRDLGTQGPTDPAFQCPSVRVSQRSSVHIFLIASSIALCALLLPLRVIFEINADWPLISWTYAGIVVLLTLQVVHLAGGWPWVRHFFFPICFILLAIAWPYRIEKGLTQNLMQVVAGITVEVLGWFGIPALQKGNLIEVSTGVVGVDEACSGIRSLQSTLMASLFMGELYRLRLLPRAGLLVCGLALAFGLNITRTLLLSWEANKHGIEAIHKWHDPAGLTIAVACFFGLWLLAIWIRSRSPIVAAPQCPSLPESSRPAPQSPSVPKYRGPSVPKSECPSVPPPPFSAFSFQLSTFPRRYLLGIGAWALAAIVVTESWYRAHDNPRESGFNWNVSFPTNTPSYRQLELTDRVKRLLGHDAGGAGSWTDDQGKEWSVYFFRWNPRSIQAVMMSRNHRPDVCLPASGLQQIGSSTVASIPTGELELPFRRYTYQSGTQTLYVFFCQWEDAAERQSAMHATKQGDRLASVLTGRRRVGQQTLEIILSGYNTAEEAETAVRGQVKQLIRVQKAQASQSSAKAAG